MRIYFETDLEGATGVFNMPMVSRGDPLFAQAYAGLAGDINAAVEGALEGGADECYVTDGHGAQGLDWSLVDPRAVHGRMEGLESFDAMFIIGQHAQAGTMNAFLDHTQSSESWFRYSVNGRPTGEIGQSAMYAASCGAPVILLSGDEAAVREAQDFLGDIETAAVKRGIGRNRCIQYDPDDCRRRIREAARRAVERFRADPSQFRPYTPVLPAVCELVFTRADYCDACMKWSRRAERIDARTIRWVAGNYREIFP